MSLAIAGRIARRELRGGLKGFRVFLAVNGTPYDAAKAEDGLREASLDFEGLTFLERKGETNKRVDSGMRISGRVPHPFFGW